VDVEVSNYHEIQVHLHNSAQDVFKFIVEAVCNRVRTRSVDYDWRYLLTDVGDGYSETFER